MPQAARYEFGTGTIVHHHLAWETVEPDRFSPEVGGWDTLAAEVAQLDADTILISAESLLRMTYTDEHRELFESQLARISDDITVIFVVRDQISAINSHYNQRVKSLRYTDTFDSHVTRVLGSRHFDLDHLFHTWYDSDLLTLVAVPFNELVSMDPFVSFLRAAGITVPEDQIAVSESSNESLGPVGVEVLRLLGAYLRILDPDFDPKGDATMKTYRVAARRVRNNGWASEKHWGWDPEEAVQTAKHFAVSNQLFANALWHTDWTIPMPVMTPQNIARITEVEAEEITLIQRFVDGMAKLYLELVTGRRYRSTPRENDL